MRIRMHKTLAIDVLGGMSPALVVAVALASAGLFAGPAVAQQGSGAEQGAAVGGVGESQIVTMRATVQQVDRAERTVTVVRPDGESVEVKVGLEVRNFDQMQPGDNVVVRYYESVAYVIAPARQQAPEDMASVATARTPPGARPGAAVAEKIIVTGVVVAVDPGTDTISLVNPAGGKVQTLKVRDEQNQTMLGLVNVGDSITAYLTEAVAVAVEPAQ